jgi:hypothetical protein
MVQRMLVTDCAVLAIVGYGFNSNGRFQLDDALQMGKAMG